MESEHLQAFVRVLYTVNNNPQYILAKSSSQVPAIVCSEAKSQSPSHELAYARTTLKACLTAVCDSSPELLQDPTRDFSLYVLDPLEAQPPPTGLASATHSSSSPRGVAVALGLMSWALESSDSMNVLVTGTVIPNVPPALEVIFALRETKRMPKPVLYSYSSGPISAPGPSQPLNSLHSQAAGTSRPASHVERDQQGQRTLTRSADFPELYIGPPRRAPGRPGRSISSKSKGKPQSRSSSLRGTSSPQTAETQSDSQQKVGKKAKQRAKSRPPRAPPTYSPFICEPLTRSTTAGHSVASATNVSTFYQQSRSSDEDQVQSHTQIHPQTQSHSRLTHNALLGLLSAIPSTSSGAPVLDIVPGQQAALLTALQELIATNPHLLELATTNTGLSSTTAGQRVEEKLLRGGNSTDVEQDDADSDIIILDSSTVDTAAFRKPSHKELAASCDTGTSSHAINQESSMPNRQGTELWSPLPASTPPSEQEGTPASSQTSTPDIRSQTRTPTPKHAPSELTECGSVIPSHAFSIPTTPTSSRTRKRKLDEYVLGQAHPSIPTSPPSPSPSVTRTLSSARTLTAAQRTLSSPTYEVKSAVSPSMRLPSMLGSMRSMITSRNSVLTTSLVSGPSKSRTDHPVATSSSTTLKRKLNLNLNEVMEEREARKNAKIRKRPFALERGLSLNRAQVDLSRSSKLMSALRHAQSSPPRPLFKSESAISLLSGSTCQPALVPNAATANPALPTSTASACTGPSAPTSTAASTRNPLKNFVTPAWARTTTATLPRLSEEVLARQRAEREAKKAQVALRRREAAKAKRRRLCGAERPSQESSDEDDDAVAVDPKPQALHTSSTLSRSVPLLPPPSLPVFASDAVVPVPSSPTPQELPLPTAPKTPPRKPVSPVSAPHLTPNKSGSCSLFTPSGQDPGSLFTPSTPSVTRPLTRASFTPRSPTVLHRPGTNKSPCKSLPEAPWTPKRNSAGHHTPRSSRSGRNVSFASPSLAMRTPRMQTGMGTRTFLLPPPSPCTSRTPHQGDQPRSKASESGPLLAPQASETVTQQSPSDGQNPKEDKGSKEDVLGYQPDEALSAEDVSMPPARCSPGHSTVDEIQCTSELRDVASNRDVAQATAEYAPSPLPPSSPLPASPFSSPAKRHDSDVDTPTLNELVVPDSDIPLPSTSDPDGPQDVGIVDPAWLSNDACTASWLTDSEASAWLTETEAWLTDTEGGGPLLTDSDGAWLSDSDAVFGDMSSLPPSSASNWFSDDADVDTDGECGAVGGREGGFDTVAFEKAFKALVGRGGRSIGDGDASASGTNGTRTVESEFWDAMQPLLGGKTSDETAGATRDIASSNAVDQDQAAQGLKELLDGLVDT